MFSSPRPSGIDHHFQDGRLPDAEGVPEVPRLMLLEIAPRLSLVVGVGVGIDVPRTPSSISMAILLTGIVDQEFMSLMSVGACRCRRR